MSRLLFSQCKKLLFNVKKYSTTRIYSEEYSVSPFCNLFVTCPFNVKIRPLDVHKYPNCDKLIINLYSNVPKTSASVTCIEEDEKFNIFGETSGDRDHLQCIIETPVKSDINVITTHNGSIDIKKLNGEKILLKSELGNITSDSCQTSKIKYESKGNITTLGTLHAADIELQTKKDSNITINHLQALKATVATEYGDIIVKSSYCDDTKFETRSGKLILDNIHKNCSVVVSDYSTLQMTGFDGTLNIDMQAGDMDIQVSKLYDASKIMSRSKNNIILRLSEWIQENTQLKTTCQQLKIADEVKLDVRNEETYAVLTPKNLDYTSQLEIYSTLAKVDVEGASWSDMLKLKGIKFMK